ncbi:MAG: hypothetical protein ABH849_05220 [Nanoarchaeota archaeon]
MKKTLIFVLAIVMFLVSSCSEERLSMPKSSIEGGSGGNIECYTSEDCPTPTWENYCEGDNACTERNFAMCVNGGTEFSYCDTLSYTDCEECTNGCDTGDCIIVPDATYQGILNMLNENCIVTNSALYGNDSLVKSCDGICAEYNEAYGKESTCILGSFGSYAPNSLMTCKILTDETIKCMCCETP